MKKKGDKKDLRNYKNSLNFVKAVKNARKYESSQIGRASCRERV